MRLRLVTNSGSNLIHGIDHSNARDLLQTLATVHLGNILIPMRCGHRYLSH